MQEIISMIVLAVAIAQSWHILRIYASAIIGTMLNVRISCDNAATFNIITNALLWSVWYYCM